MTARDKLIEAMARAFNAEVDRDISRWMERWTFEGGVYHDAPDPPKVLYQTDSQKIIQVILSAIAEQGYAVVPMLGDKAQLAWLSEENIARN